MRVDQLSVLFRRTALAVVGFAVCALGIALSARANLGISPVSSLPYVISLLGNRSFGFYVTSLYSLFVVAQFLLLKREFKPLTLAQFLSSMLCGYFVDLWEIALGHIDLSTVPARILALVVSLVSMALGCTFFLEANIVLLPNEGFVSVIAQKSGLPFSQVKVINDVSFSLCAGALSLLLLGRLHGVGIGTLVTAVLLGRLIAFFRRNLSAPLEKLCFSGQKREHPL